MAQVHAPVAPVCKGLPMRHMSRHAASAAVLSFAVLTGAMAGADPARAAGASAAAVAPAAAWDARRDLDYRPLASRPGVQDLTFYRLTRLEQTPAALAALNADPDLAAIRQAAAQRALAAAAACEASIETAGQAVAENPAPACT